MLTATARSRIAITSDQRTDALVRRGARFQKGSISAKSGDLTMSVSQGSRLEHVFGRGARP